MDTDTSSDIQEREKESKETAEVNKNAVEQLQQQLAALHLSRSEEVSRLSSLLPSLFSYLCACLPEDDAYWMAGARHDKASAC